MYDARCFTITAVHRDNKCDVKAIKEFLFRTILDIHGNDEHVGPIKRLVRTIKNKYRAMTHDTPYMLVPKVMVIALVKCAILWINAFLSKNGVSKTLSTATVVQGAQHIDSKNKRIVYGSYATVY